jgi:tetratricopeptide (TPR) repeat protein
MGERQRALELLRRGERVAQAANHLYSKVPLAIAHGHLLLYQGEPAETIRLLEPIVAICRENKFVGQTMRALTILGHGYALAGRASDAIPLLKEAIELQEGAGAFVDRAWWVRTLGEIYRRAGQLDDAETTARTALEFAHRHGETGNEAWIHALFGDIASDRGEVEAARRHFAEARKLADMLSMGPLVASCHVASKRLGDEGTSVRQQRTDEGTEIKYFSKP